MMMRSDLVPLTLRDGGSCAKYAKGGLAGAAESVADAGRYGDSYIVHVNGHELEQLRQAWGEPTVNPKTGAPEYFLNGLKDWFQDNPWAQVAVPLVGSVVAPGIGQAVGSGVNDALSLGLSPTATQAVGNALTYGGLGYLTGGGQGALTGALVGGLTPYAANMLGMGGSDGVAGKGLADTAHGGMGPDVPQASSSSGGSGSSGAGGLFGGSGALAKAIPLMMMAGAFAGNGAKDSGAHTVSADQQAAIDQQSQKLKPLSEVKFNRARTPMPQDLTRYGYGPEQNFYRSNRTPQFAKGGMPQGQRPPPAGALAVANHLPARYVEGPGTGRSDEIPARLSKNEYVLDAETVALLGDGAPDAGAKALDRMRENIRAHKGGALARGRISPNAKPPDWNVVVNVSVTVLDAAVLYVPSLSMIAEAEQVPG